MESLFNVKEIHKKYSGSGVYLIVIGSKMYIGSSVRISDRLVTHKRRLTIGKHENPIMINCYNKYGSDSCFFKILELCNNNILTKREKYYIDTLKPELNIETNPVDQDGTYKGKKVFQYDMNGEFLKEHKSCSAAGRSFNKNGSMIASCARGNTNFRSAHGYLWSYNKVEKLYYENKSRKAKIKPVTQYDLKGNKLQEFESIADAVRVVNAPGKFDSLCTGISACCRKIIKQSLGYKWEYKTNVGT